MLIIKLIDEMESLLTKIRTDAEKFEIHGNALAGTRVRKGMQVIKAKAQEIRVSILTIKDKRKEN